MKQLKYIVLIFLMSSLSCMAQTTEKKRMKLVWSDEFNYTGLPDSSKWSYESGYVRNKEPQFYTKKCLDNCRVENGMLIIEAKEGKETNCDIQKAKEAKYTSASINTLGKASWKYGRIEVRAKLPAGNGTWPAIWMVGENGSQVGWPACGEIDIMEHLGKLPSDIIATVHYADTTKIVHKQQSNRFKADNPDADFHIYALEWFPDHLDFYYDDNKYFTFNIADSQHTTFNPFQKKQYLLLNLALGAEGLWPGPVDKGVLPCRFMIDYVRVYKFRKM